MACYTDRVLSTFRILHHSLECLSCQEPTPHSFKIEIRRRVNEGSTRHRFLDWLEDKIAQQNTAPPSKALDGNDCRLCAPAWPPYSRTSITSDQRALPMVFGSQDGLQNQDLPFTSESLLKDAGMDGTCSPHDILRCLFENTTGCSPVARYQRAHNFLTLVTNSGPEFYDRMLFGVKNLPFQDSVSRKELDSVRKNSHSAMQSLLKTWITKAKAESSLDLAFLSHFLMKPASLKATFFDNTAPNAPHIRGMEKRAALWEEILQGENLETAGPEPLLFSLNHAYAKSANIEFLLHLKQTRREEGIGKSIQSGLKKRRGECITEQDYKKEARLARERAQRQAESDRDAATAAAIQNKKDAIKKAREARVAAFDDANRKKADAIKKAGDEKDTAFKEASQQKAEAIKAASQEESTAKEEAKKEYDEAMKAAGAAEVEAKRIAAKLKSETKSRAKHVKDTRLTKAKQEQADATAQAHLDEEEQRRQALLGVDGEKADAKIEATEQKDAELQQVTVGKTGTEKETAQRNLYEAARQMAQAVESAAIKAAEARQSAAGERAEIEKSAAIKKAKARYEARKARAEAEAEADLVFEWARKRQQAAADRAEAEKNAAEAHAKEKRRAAEQKAEKTKEAVLTRLDEEEKAVQARATRENEIAVQKAGKEEEFAKAKAKKLHDVSVEVANGEKEIALLNAGADKKYALEMAHYEEQVALQDEEADTSEEIKQSATAAQEEAQKAEIAACEKLVADAAISRAEAHDTETNSLSVAHSAAEAEQKKAKETEEESLNSARSAEETAKRVAQEEEESAITKADQAEAADREKAEQAENDALEKAGRDEGVTQMRQSAEEKEKADLKHADETEETEKRTARAAEESAKGTAEATRKAEVQAAKQQWQNAVAKAGATVKKSPSDPAIAPKRPQPVTHETGGSPSIPSSGEPLPEDARVPSTQSGGEPPKHSEDELPTQPPVQPDAPDENSAQETEQKPADKISGQGEGEAVAKEGTQLESATSDMTEHAADSEKKAEQNAVADSTAGQADIKKKTAQDSTSEKKPPGRDEANAGETKVSQGVPNPAQVPAPDKGSPTGIAGGNGNKRDPSISSKDDSASALNGSDGANQQGDSGLSTGAVTTLWVTGIHFCFVFFLPGTGPHCTSLEIADEKAEGPCSFLQQGVFFAFNLCHISILVPILFF